MIKTIQYTPKGTCSRQMAIAINDEDGTIVDFAVAGGCPGNLAGIRKLIIGMKASDVADKLEGVRCGAKNTSCPDQLSKALRIYLDGGNQ